jgi:hypothetical protein
MTWDFSTKGKCKVTMEKYINDLLTDNNITDTIDSPASNHLFVINPIAEKLSNDMNINFHTQVAKLLYLAKRIRPDILLPISFLSTRVQSPDIDDWKKLMRVLKYINGTVNLGITLECDNFIIDSYIDASYGVHSDFKSHTGMIIFLGKGIIDVSSSKQKINTKSSAEAELIAVSDKATKVIWSREFLIHQGYNIPPAIINQDNISTISLVKNGSSSSNRTKHISIRYFWLKDKIHTKDIEVQYLPTDEMIADLLTKPLHGAKFIQLRKLLLNSEI